jgi:predicted Zn finger-like uncharacterized protein
MPQITCPHCRQPYEIPPEQWPQYRGQRITCTRCNQPFDVIDPSGPPVAPPMPQAYPGAVPVGYAQGQYGPSGMVPPKQGMSGGQIALLVCGIAFVLLLVCGGLFAILVPSLGRAREQANRVKSANNLRQIGLAAMLYANGDPKEGRFPDDEKTIIKTQDITIDVFVSPRTHTVKPTTTDPGELGDWANDNSDYAWVGAGHKNVEGADTVLAYEKPDGLQDGIEVLYADGHVEFITMAKAQTMISAVKSGMNPPASSKY